MRAVSLVLGFLVALLPKVLAWGISSSNSCRASPQRSLYATPRVSAGGIILQRRSRFLLAASDKSDDETTKNTLLATSSEIEEESEEEINTPASAAAVNTVNERLLAELNAASEREVSGKNSKRRAIVNEVRSRKSDAEREKAIEEARNLNGVNPAVAMVGGILAMVAAFFIWEFTTTWVAAHLPVLNEVDTPYAALRLASLFRNVVMGGMSLASGFFGVTGLGIFCLGIRVAYGVLQGELDPTPLASSSADDKDSNGLVLPGAWDLMMGKNPTDRRQRKNNNKNDKPPSGN
eukprot:scaffold208756_cov46-Attheya_sp.AAC.2